MSKHRVPGLKAFSFCLALAAAGALKPAQAQQVDARWLPWVGCWEATSDVPTHGELLCVRPTAQAGGMEFLRVAEDGAVLAREVLWGDGQRHETSRESCTGWEEGSFSQDGRRLFLTSEYTCGGDVMQQGGGIIAMASPTDFLDVRVAGMGGEHLAWVQRFHAATDAQAEAAGFADLLQDRSWSVGQARMLASAPLDVEDVIEASHAVPAEAVQAFLAERGDRMEIKAAQVVQLADAGVPDEIIDVAVATAYPQYFQVDADAEAQAQSALDEGSLRRRWGTRASLAYDPYLPWSLRFGYYGYSPYGYGYSPYGYGYGYGYYGYGYGYGGYGGYRPVIIQVDRTGGSTSGGRVINGKGYSQGRGTASGRSQSYIPRASSGTARSSRPSATRSGSSGSGSARTAKPRGGGAAPKKPSGSSAPKKAKPRSGGGGA